MIVSPRACFSASSERATHLHVDDDFRVQRNAHRGDAQHFIGWSEHDTGERSMARPATVLASAMSRLEPNGVQRAGLGGLADQRDD